MNIAATNATRFLPFSNLPIKTKKIPYVRNAVQRTLRNLFHRSVVLCLQIQDLPPVVPIQDSAGVADGPRSAKP